MNTTLDQRKAEAQETAEWLIAYLEVENAKKAARAAMKKTANTPRPFISFPELAFPSDWCPPAALEELPAVAVTAPKASPAFDREAFFAIEISAVTRSPAGVVEMIAFRSTDANGFVTSQTMYADPKPTISAVDQWLNAGQRKAV